MFIQNKKLYYVYNFLGIGDEQVFTSAEITPGKYVFGVEFTKKGFGKFREATGTTKLYVNDKPVATGPMKTEPLQFSLCGEGLCIGYDGGDVVSKLYKSKGKYEFTGGTINEVMFDVADDAYVDVEKAMAAAMSRD